MESKVMSNAIAGLATGEGFSIHGEVTNKSEYESNVIFSDPSKRPSWENVQAKIPDHKWNEVRGQRNRCLMVSDWTVLADSPLTTAKKNKWKTYRQSLRDITTQADPDNLDWPTAPEA